MMLEAAFRLFAINIVLESFMLIYGGLLPTLNPLTWSDILSVIFNFWIVLELFKKDSPLRATIIFPAVGNLFLLYFVFPLLTNPEDTTVPVLRASVHIFSIAASVFFLVAVAVNARTLWPQLMSFLDRALRNLFRIPQALGLGMLVMFLYVQYNTFYSFYIAPEVAKSGNFTVSFGGLIALHFAIGRFSEYMVIPLLLSAERKALQFSIIWFVYRVLGGFLEFNAIPGVCQTINKSACQPWGHYPLVEDVVFLLLLLISTRFTSSRYAFPSRA